MYIERCFCSVVFSDPFRKKAPIFATYVYAHFLIKIEFSERALPHVLLVLTSAVLHALGPYGRCPTPTGPVTARSQRRPS